MRNCYFENRRRYGARRISKALDKNGIEIGRGKVRRLMKQENLKAITAKAFKPKTRDSKATTAAPNLSARTSIRECAAAKIIIGDITYIRLRDGKFCYPAVWQDKVTRRIIGWSLAEAMTQELVISTLTQDHPKRTGYAPERSFIRMVKADTHRTDSGGFCGRIVFVKG